jgi:signal transduction histidine kinase
VAPNNDADKPGRLRLAGDLLPPTAVFAVAARVDKVVRELDRFESETTWTEAHHHGRFDDRLRTGLRPRSLLPVGLGHGCNRVKSIRGQTVETVDRSEAGAWDVVEASQSVSDELARLNDIAQVAACALRWALELTKSSGAFVALVDDAGSMEVFSRAASPTDKVPREKIEALVAAARASSSPVTETLDSTSSSTMDPASQSSRSFCGQPLQAGGKVIGMIGVARSSGYPAIQRRTFAVFGNQVAAALEIAQMQRRRQEMVDTLVNLRTELDRSEKQRLQNEERAQSAERVERAHEAAVAALLAVSAHARTGRTLSDFYRRLTASIADLVSADKVLFWELNDEGMLVAIPGAHGVDDAFIGRLYPTRCAPDRDDLTSNVVFRDYPFRASRIDDPPEFQYVLDALSVHDAISVAWRAGDQRLGLVAAYDCRRPEGFSREDTWVLQKAGLAAGLVWQLRHAEADLKKTIERLQKVDTARQLLLKNVSTAVDKARKRFASELHDDALQKLTAAELQLQRLTEPSGAGKTVLSQAQSLLSQTEDALRRLMFEVRPPALDIPGGFEETIRDRVAMLRSLTGIEAELLLDIPEELSYEFKSMVFRQVAEALTNVEKHAAATRVQVSVRRVDGAVHGLVVDNGRGFVVSERDHLPGHLGLLALNERALLAGGWAKIESEPGVGTTVEFWMPTGL